jgi:hypothetical protein
MTPEARDRNIVRVRRFTGAIAGIALAACGLFAGLAASATQKVFSSPATTTTTSTQSDDRTEATTTTPTTTTKATTTTTAAVTPVTVTPTQSAPIASSGGS